MALIRMAYAADLPGPEEALRKLAEGGALAGAAAARSAAGSRARSRKPSPRSAAVRPPARALPRFEDVVALARSKRDVALARALEHDMRIVRSRPGRIEFTPAADRLADARADAGEKTRGVDRRALDDRRRARRDRADAARDGRKRKKTRSAKAPPRIRSCEKCWSSFPARRSLRSERPKSPPPEAPPPTDEDVGYAEPPDDETI